MPAVTAFAVEEERPLPAPGVRDYFLMLLR